MRFCRRTPLLRGPARTRRAASVSERQTGPGSGLAPGSRLGPAHPGRESARLLQALADGLLEHGLITHAASCGGPPRLLRIGAPALSDRPWRIWIRRNPLSRHAHKFALRLPAALRRRVAVGRCRFGLGPRDVRRSARIFPPFAEFISRSMALYERRSASPTSSIQRRRPTARGRAARGGIRIPYIHGWCWISPACRPEGAPANVGAACRVTRRGKCSESRGR